MAKLTSKDARLDEMKTTWKPMTKVPAHGGPVLIGERTRDRLRLGYFFRFPVKDNKTGYLNHWRWYEEDESAAWLSNSDEHFWINVPKRKLPTK